MVSKVYRVDFELTVPIFHNRLTSDEDLLENTFYKVFLKEALMSHLITHVVDSKMLFESKNDYFHNSSKIQLCLIMLSKESRF